MGGIRILVALSNVHEVKSQHQGPETVSVGSITPAACQMKALVRSEIVNVFAFGIKLNLS